MTSFEVNFKYLLNEYTAYVRRAEHLPYIISVKGSDKLAIPDNFTLKPPVAIDPFRYRYPGLAHAIAEAINTYCGKHDLAF